MDNLSFVENMAQRNREHSITAGGRGGLTAIQISTGKAQPELSQGIVPCGATKAGD